MQLDLRSATRLSEAHHDLQRVILRAAEITDLDFIVTESARTEARQAQLLAKGASKTMRSRHIPSSNACGQCCAVDLAVKIGKEVRWDWPLYDRLGAVVKEAAKIEGVPITWGGDWLRFKDGPHFELNAKHYPMKVAA